LYEYSWTDLVEYVLITLVGLFVGLTTRPVIGRPKNLADLARRYARITGLMIGIGGWIPVIHLLVKLLSARR
jgi:hypothetical protein